MTIEKRIELLGLNKMSNDELQKQYDAYIIAEVSDCSIGDLHNANTSKANIEAIAHVINSRKEAANGNP